MEYPTCPDCGPAPINHQSEYAYVIINSFLSPFNRSILFIRRRIVAPILLPLKLDWLALPLFRFLKKLHLGTINEKPDALNNSRTRALWESADQLGIRIYEFRMFGRALETFVAELNGQYKFFYQVPRPSKPLSSGFWWMDDKPTMRKQFTKAGIPVAFGKSCFRYSQALKTFRAINSEAITKPSYGSRSRHTTVHIQNESQLHQAFTKAKQLSPFVVVEQHLAGQVFRASVIGRKLAGVLSRNQPSVIGDGRSNISKLVEAENQNPKRLDGTFHQIPLDQEAEKELKRQNLVFNSVPAAGQVVYLSDKVSRGVGAVTSDYTEQTHPDNCELFEKVAQTLDDDLVGIDFIIEDISRSFRDQVLCGVIECNSAPFLDLHHYPYHGKARAVSEQLWRLIFQLPNQEQESAQQTP